MAILEDTLWSEDPVLRSQDRPGLKPRPYYFARTSFAAGDIARSAELFHRAADVSRQDFQSPILEAQSLRMLGRMIEAGDATREGVGRAERLLALNPIDGRALSLGSAALFHDGQIVRSMEWSRLSLELYPDDIGTLIKSPA